MDADILDGSWVNCSRFTWALSGARNRRAQWHCSTRSKYVQHHILLAGPNQPTIGDTQEENVPYPSGHREETRRRIVRSASARNKADSLPTHAGSLMRRTSPADPKSMFNLFRHPRTAAARLRSLVMVAASPDGGGMARN